MPLLLKVFFNIAEIGNGGTESHRRMALFLRSLISRYFSQRIIKAVLIVCINKNTFFYYFIIAKLKDMLYIVGLQVI